MKPILWIFLFLPIMDNHTKEQRRKTMQFILFSANLEKKIGLLSKGSILKIFTYFLIISQSCRLEISYMAKIPNNAFYRRRYPDAINYPAPISFVLAV